MTSSEKINSLIQTILKPGEVFHIDIKKDWGSENLDYRTEIRKGILEYLKTHHPDQVSKSIWDLEAPPVLPSLFVSISHCVGMGGFVLSSKSLGFDIEDKTRITQKIIDRVSSEEELKTCPQFELLWPAKEAIFKCSTEFYTIAHIQIQHWEKSQYETFSFKSLTADGWAFLDSNHSYAVAIKKL
jgi:4'-phosphopantetheinyl transferase superfamily